MSLTHRRANYKKAAVAVVSASALILAACGSDEEGGDTGTDVVTTSASTTVTSSAAASSSSQASSTSKTTSKEEGEPAAAPAEGQPAEGQPNEANPDNIDPEVLAQAEQFPVDNVEQQPVEGGETASPEDAAAITALVNGINDQTTLRGFMGYIPNNACSRAMANAQDLDLNQIPDINLADFPEFQNAKANIDSVDNIIVNGDEASADVTTSHNGVVETGVQRFLWEGDRWTFCD